MHGFRVSARLVGLSLIFTASGLAPASAQGNAPPLGAYNADIKESSISGISSGADMAVQFGVSWSSTIKGVGVIAGSPYYCVQGTAAEGLSGNLVPDLMVTGPCMKGPPPALGPLIAKADEWARLGDIDDTRNIAHQRVYISPDTMTFSSIQKSSTLPTSFIFITYLIKAKAICFIRTQSARAILR